MIIRIVLMFIVVPNLDVKFSVVKLVNWNSSSCSVSEECDTSSPPDCQLPDLFDMSLENKSNKQALAFYSRYYIVNVVIPELVMLYEHATFDLSNDPQNATLKLKADHLNSALNDWNTILLNEQQKYDSAINFDSTSWSNVLKSSSSSLISVSTPLIPQDLQKNAILLDSWKGNTNKVDGQQIGDWTSLSRIQFSGGSSMITETLSHEYTYQTLTTGNDIEGDFTIHPGALTTETGLPFFDAIIDFDPTVTWSFLHYDDRTDMNTQHTDISFSLGDPDSNNEFVIDLFIDDKYGGLIFKTTSGRSSCPHEDGT